MLLVLQAGIEGDEVRARIETAERLDEAVAKHQKGMRIFLRDERPIGSVQERLRARGEGEVSLVLILDNGEREVEVRLPGRYMASPQVAGALQGGAGGGRRGDELSRERLLWPSHNGRLSGSGASSHCQIARACNAIPRAR